MSAELLWRCPGCGGPLPEQAGERACPCGRRWWREGALWRRQGGGAPDHFDAQGAARLTALDENDHFWFTTRLRLLGRLLRRLAPGGPGAVLELGCGTGAMLAALAGEARRVVGVDGWPGLLAVAARRCPGATLLQAEVEAVPLAPEQFDTVLALDVLEHVDPDRLLGEARRLVRPGGRLLISVPAFPLLWSAADQRAGHRCRYRRAQLYRELARNGWRPEGYTHFQCLLFPLVAASRLLGRRTQQLEHRPPGWAGRLLWAVNRLEVALLAGVALPFGSSLIAWARAEP